MMSMRARSSWFNWFDAVVVRPPRTEFTSPGLDEPGLPSEVFVAATGGFIDGPIADFNDEFAPVNGVVDGISLFDMPFYEPAP